jgi:ankyrin repeat protein
LLEKGVDIRTKDNSGQTVLYSMAKIGHGVVVELLLEKGGRH